MIFRQLIDSETRTYSYLLADAQTREAVLIDPVLEQVERDVALVRELGLRLVYSLETHVHADHVTAGNALRERVGSQVVVSRRAGARGVDVLVDDGDSVVFGKPVLEVRATPGHTNGCVTYVTADQRMAFTGDALFVRGTGRTDFQQGSARTLYRSIHDKLFTLPNTTLVYPGHDYKGHTVSTVAEEKAHNPRLAGKSEDAFVSIMSALDLPRPQKIDEAVPKNLLCGAGSEQEVGAAQARMALLGSWAPVTRSATGVPEVTAAWVAGPGIQFRLVDVRELEEFRGELGHVAGSELVPLANLQKAAHDWSRSEPVVLICRSGGRSGRAALTLEALGFEHVTSMRGGMLAYNEMMMGREVVA